jgi:hypothetical protein
LTAHEVEPYLSKEPTGGAQVTPQLGAPRAVGAIG